MHKNVKLTDVYAHTDVVEKTLRTGDIVKG
jgi:hypothetical protein